jgi:UDP-N-acetylmuramate--alanine ligase
MGFYISPLLMQLFSTDDLRPVHFMGVAGAGMSALALLARRRGVVVTGCDREPDGAGAASSTADVRRAGGVVFAGHDPGHVSGARAVVVTAAIPPDHPELERARALGIPIVRRADALAAAIAPGRVVAVAGTHGKTTTTAMTTEALAAAGMDPTGIAGGRVTSWAGNTRFGGDAIFVVEADEYDKSFLALSAEVAVINNVEADHLECYGSLAALEEAFTQFARPARRVISGADDPGARRVAARAGRPTWTVGVAAQADVRIGSVRQVPSGSTATVALPGGTKVELRLKVPGIHNIRNAAAALAVTLELGGSLDSALEALGAFEGVGRRFELVGEVAGVTVVDDYAHHPTEIAATLEGARQAYPHRRLLALFQPHLYSRTALHGAAMGKALSQADVVVVTGVYAARESPIEGVTGRLVADAVRRPDGDVHWVESRKDLVEEVASLVRAGDVVLTMGAGDVTAAGPELLARLAERKRAAL